MKSWRFKTLRFDDQQIDEKFNFFDIFEFVVFITVQIGGNLSRILKTFKRRRQ